MNSKMHCHVKELGAEQCDAYEEDKEDIWIYFHIISDFTGNS